MAEANKDEVDKCKQIAQNALAAGDTEKAIRFLHKAKRMIPSDASIDALLAKAANGGGSSAAGADRSSAGPAGMRQRAAASGSSDAAGTRSGKDGRNYTSEQMQLVQRILRTKDYYDILEVPKDSNEDAVKKAYKKLALKLHPDKNKAPGAEEAFKKLSKAVQCLTDQEKKHVYDRYGDEDQMPQRHRQQYQQDFMTPEDLFSAFFGGGVGTFHTFHQQRAPPQGQGHQNQNEGQAVRAQLGQALPLLILVLLTVASNFASRDTGSRFSFTATAHYRNERTSAELNVNYYVADDFDDHYGEGTRSLAEFERQVEIYQVRNLHGECDYQEKMMHKRVMIAKRRGNQEELQQAKNHPRPACKQIEKIKRNHNSIYRSAMYMASGY